MILSYFLNDGPQRYVGGQSVYARRGQLHHAATVGAFERQAERTPDGIVGGHLEQVVQAALTEGVRARQDSWVTEQRVAHGARQVLLQVVHGGDERPGSGLREKLLWCTCPAKYINALQL